MILQHLDTLTSRQKYLTEINAQINTLTMNIKPNGQYNPSDSDIFFEDDNVIISIQNLGYGGKGAITDMETNVKESITIDSQLEPVQIILKMSTKEKDGKIYPKVDVVSTKLKIIPGTIVIDAKGDLPLYKTQKFDQGIKNWLTSQAMVREGEFKTSIRNAE